MSILNRFELELCNRCKMSPEDNVLRDVAYDEDRYLPDLVRKARQEPESPLGREAMKKMIERLEDEEGEEDPSLGEYLTDNTDEDGDAPGVPGRSEKILEEDVRKVLEDYENDGLIDVQDGKVIVTSRGAKKLAAGALERILRSLNNRTSGSTPKELPELGVEFSNITRRYEPGDDYSLVDIEKTLLNSLDRCGKIDLEPEDFEIREEVHRPRRTAQAGLRTDSSRTR